MCSKWQIKFKQRTLKITKKPLLPHTRQSNYNISKVKDVYIFIWTKRNVLLWSTNVRASWTKRYVGQIMEHKWKTERIKDRKDMNEQYINGSWQEDGVSSEKLASSSFLFILQSRKIPNNPVARIILPLADLPLFHNNSTNIVPLCLNHFNSTSLVNFEKVSVERKLWTQFRSKIFVSTTSFVSIKLQTHCWN